MVLLEIADTFRFKSRTCVDTDTTDVGRWERGERDRLFRFADRARNGVDLSATGQNYRTFFSRNKSVSALAIFIASRTELKLRWDKYKN
jgi:hypothetical protein